MRHILSIFIGLFVISSNFAQSDCSAICTVDPLYRDSVVTHLIFNGNDTTDLNVKSTVITAVPAQKKLVKRKDPNCLSSNPVECIKEVYEEMPAVTMRVYTLPANTKTDQYDKRTETFSVIKRAGGTVTEPIICPANRTKRLVTKLQNALVQKGYPLLVSGVYDKATEVVVIDFQKSINLPYGDLTLATLAALGIN
jgi:hypothetical protein